MQLIPEIVAVHEELTAWRRNLHAYPELAFEESRTAEFVANQLESFGIQVTRGVGKTGVVGSLKIGNSAKAIGLRADMDALPMEEQNTFAHKSKTPGCMHGCGHDGHTVMLLAAARYLSDTKNFDGTVHFIFQPAEEANGIGSGAKAMIDDGLFERFPVDNVFAMHNCPGLYVGAMATRADVMTASMDLFEVTLKGKGTHGAYPHTGNDPLMVVAHLLLAWQTIISRNVNADEAAVISATSINTVDSWNVIPDTVVIKGSIRTRSPEVRQTIEQRFRTLTQQIAQGFDVEANIDYRPMYPCCINDPIQTAFAVDVAESILGEDRVLGEMALEGMGSEDFAYMLQKRPGCYLLLGAEPLPPGRNPMQGKSIKTLADQDAFEFKDACTVHQPDYDFNDEIIPVGASFFARLAEQYLSE
ncbi:M20 family metallopeptidase [Porticoccaceae bacterium]|nr:M20 family metallopeptidase [Porticoccaceae bacterium]